MGLECAYVDLTAAVVRRTSLRKTTLRAAQCAAEQPRVSASQSAPAGPENGNGDNLELIVFVESRSWVEGVAGLNLWFPRSFQSGEWV